jgi:hypothetical protein
MMTMMRCCVNAAVDNPHDVDKVPHNSVVGPNGSVDIGAGYGQEDSSSIPVRNNIIY